MTPEEKILGSNFLKKKLTFLSNFILKFKIGLKYFLVKKSNIKNCNIPAKDTAYDNIKTLDILSHFE